MTASLSRRGFLAANAALAATALPHAPSLDYLTTAPGHSSGWDMSWVTRLRGDHRIVLDAPAIDGGLTFGHAWLCYRDVQDVYQAEGAGANVVVVIRHQAIPMGLNDSVWDKYELGKQYSMKDPTTGVASRRNPFWHLSESDSYRQLTPAASMEALAARGTIFLVCDFALSGLAKSVAQSRGTPEAETIRDFETGLVPGGILMPSGVFAVSAAVRAGCSYIRST